MVPDDLVKPAHLSIAVAALTPDERPQDLTEEIWAVIRTCDRDNPGFDAAEIHECVTTGACQEKITQPDATITLPVVLYAVTHQMDSTTTQ